MQGAGGVWEEIAGAAGRRELRCGGTLCGRRWRLPGEALIKLDVGLGLAEAVPVRHRPEIIVPTGWVKRDEAPNARASDCSGWYPSGTGLRSAGAGPCDRRWHGGLADQP